MRHARTFALACAVAGWLPTAAAQEEERPRRDAETALAEFAGCDPSLLGTTHLGFYLQGRHNIGSATWTVERAPEDSGAAYQVRLEATLGPAGARTLSREEVDLDPRFALVRGKYREVEQRGEVERRRSRSLSRAGGAWTERLGTRDAAERVLTLADDQPNYADLSALLLLARKLDRRAPGKLVLRGAWFPPPAEPGADAPQGQPESRPVRVDVLTPEELVWRGRRVVADRVRLIQPGQETLVVWLGKGGELLQFGPEAFDLRVIAGAPEEVARDLPPPPPPVGPEDAVRLYLRVRAKLEPAGALDRVLDWEAVHRDRAEGDPAARDLDVATFAAVFKATVEREQPAVDPGALEGLRLEADVDGDQASVRASAGPSEPFELRRAGRGWRIVHFPAGG